MVKSKPSTTGTMAMATQASFMKNFAAIGYPESMEELVKPDGKISLNAFDYAGYTEDEIRNFLSSREYEVGATFGPDGSLIRVWSQFGDGNVQTTIYAIEQSISKAQEKSGIERGYKDFHNHPIESAAIVSIWSPSDMQEYARQVWYYDGFNGQVLHGAHDVYEVDTSLGHRFKMEYVPGLKKSPSVKAEDIGDAYETAFFESVNRYKTEVDAGSITSGQAATNITSDMDSWMKRNAGNYGFKYESNWRW